MKHQAKIANIVCPKCERGLWVGTDHLFCNNCLIKFKFPTVEIEEIEEPTKDEKNRNRMAEILEDLKDISKGNIEREILIDEFLNIMDFKVKRWRL